MIIHVLVHLHATKQNNMQPEGRKVIIIDGITRLYMYQGCSQSVKEGWTTLLSWTNSL